MKSNRVNKIKSRAIQQELFLTLLGHRHRSNSSFPGSARERTAPEALPQFALRAEGECLYERLAEPAIQWVPRQSLGTSWWRSPRSVLFLVFLMGCLFQTRTSHAGFLLTLSLSNATQLSANEVAFDIQASFVGIESVGTCGFVERIESS